MTSHKTILILVIAFSVFSPVNTFGQFQRHEACFGDPFGFAKISIPVTEADRELLRTNGLIITDASNRIHYPVFSSGVAKKIIDVVAGDSGTTLPKNMTVYFLFKGKEPFTAKVYTSSAFTVRVEPVQGRPLQKSLLSRAWWREFNAAARNRNLQGDYPPIIETYLTAMLGQRLGFSKPLIERATDFGLVKDQIQSIVDFFLGAELRHLKVMRETMAGASVFSGKPTHPLPREDFPVIPSTSTREESNPGIEKIASRVPQECFYVRFGQWQNQVWLKRLTREYGGDIGRMAILRGIEPNSIVRFEQQLCLEQDPLAETFGQAVISDFALIGRDFYFNEGAALGVLFEERNALLSTQIKAARVKILKREKAQGAFNETVDIAGHSVSFIGTADNRLRSFYAKDGEYHLITNCRDLVRRFFECGENKQTMSKSPEFIQTRAAYPLKREDTVFAFMPTHFFRSMLSSKYQVENARRQQALVDMELLQLAMAAAKGEGASELLPEELIATGFLPPDFSNRVDLSGPIATKAQVIDSLRGARGCFIPIPDVKVNGITAAELAQLKKQNDLVRQDWKSMVPLVATIKRERLDRKGRERLSFSANVSCLLGKKAEFFTGLLGSPTQYKHGTSPNDIINLHASINGGLLFKNVPPHQIFVCIQDEPTPPITVMPAGFFSWLQLLKGFPGYVGASPKPGFLDIWTPQLARPDETGFSYSNLLGVHRMQDGDYSVLSSDKRRLERLKPSLGAIKAETYGQIHVNVGDLSTSQIVPLINTLFYQRALQASLGNIKLLNAMSQQLKVDSLFARSEVEKLIDGKLVCSLEGNYKTLNHPNGRTYWTSDRLPPTNLQEVPKDYSSNLLSWFRGANVTLLAERGQVVVSGHVEMQRKKPEKKTGNSIIPSRGVFGNGIESKPKKQK
ncbi:MAG: hypothetical protein VX438_05695 [Planctomycetota bacterium]|nr:hypothetical protein [Planctomycetota bacterium]